MTSIKDTTYELERLAALQSYHILDTEQEVDFDEIVDLASKICNKPISLISLVDDKRQWFKAKVGLNISETPVEIAFCKHAIEHNNLFLIEDATLDERFKNNPLVTNHPDIRFYAGTPLQTIDGYNIGTLCVLDNEPGQITLQQQEALTILGKQVMKQLELRRALNNQNRILRELEQQRNEMQRLLNFKDKVFAIISHDLRGPIGGIGQVLDMIKSGAITAQDFEMAIPTLQTQVAYAEDTLNNLLSWAQSHEKGFIAEKKPTELHQLVNELVNGLQDSAAQKSVSISTNISSNIQSVQLDAHSLIIVLRNLIKNSIKFCRKGDKVSIETRLENNALQFCIKDTGVGFDDEVASKLFKEDEHITTYGTANEKGTGLGLLICKNLIEQSGGTIWAEGKPNQGATFCFIIPLS